MPKEEIYDIIRDMKCERRKSENNRIKAGRTKVGFKNINVNTMELFSKFLFMYSIFLVLFEYMIWAMPSFVMCRYVRLFVVYCS